MKTTAIYLDLDDTLCQFVSALLALHGEDINAIDWPKGWYDLCSLLAITDAELWSPVLMEGEGFWDKLTVTQWAIFLIEAVISKNVPFYIVSNLGGNTDECLRGKRLWLRRHFCGILADRFIPMYPGVCRSQLAAPGRVLIDDCDENCERWRENGGTAITVPQKWNHAEGTSGDVMVSVYNLP